MDQFTSAPASISVTPTPSASGAPAPLSYSGSSISSLSSLISIKTFTTPMTDSLRPTTPAASSLSSSTLLTSSTPLSSGSSSPVPTTTPNYWGWVCNSTSNSTTSASESGAGCTQTFLVPSSTKININLTEPTTTGGGNNSEATRTFTPGDFPGAAIRPVDASLGGVAGWAGLMVMAGLWVGLI